MTMMKAVNTLKIQKGRVDEIIPRFAQAKSVHTYEGFIFMEVLRKENTEEYDELQICTTWENHSYFEAWRTSRAAEKAHAQQNNPDQKQANSPILSAELTTFEICVQHHPAQEGAK